MTDPERRVIAVLLAGGMGSRFGGPVPKQLAPLASDTVMAHSLAALEEAPCVSEVVVVANPAWKAEIVAEATRVVRTKPLSIADGGTSRNESLRNALSQVDGDEARVLIHDAVRPLVSVDLIELVAHTLLTANCVLPAVRSSDLLVEIEGGRAKSFVSRDQVLLGQSPQGFSLEVLRATFAAENDHMTLHLPTLFEAVSAVLPGTGIEIVEGLPENIKITQPVDHMIAQRLLEHRHPSLRREQL